MRERIGRCGPVIYRGVQRRRETLSGGPPGSDRQTGFRRSSSCGGPPCQVIILSSRAACPKRMRSLDGGLRCEADLNKMPVYRVDRMSTCPRGLLSSGDWRKPSRWNYLLVRRKRITAYCKQVTARYSKTGELHRFVSCSYYPLQFQKVVRNILKTLHNWNFAFSTIITTMGHFRLQFFNSAMNISEAFRALLKRSTQPSHDPSIFKDTFL